jgi:hypothetical protein
MLSSVSFGVVTIKRHFWSVPYPSKGGGFYYLINIYRVLTVYLIVFHVVQILTHLILTANPAIGTVLFPLWKVRLQRRERYSGLPGPCSLWVVNLRLKLRQSSFRVCVHCVHSFYILSSKKTIVFIKWYNTPIEKCPSPNYTVQWIFTNWIHPNTQHHLSPPNP